VSVCICWYKLFNETKMHGECNVKLIVECSRFIQEYSPATVTPLLQQLAMRKLSSFPALFVSLFPLPVFTFFVIATC
jgi:hypothetical protein